MSGNSLSGPSAGLSEIDLGESAQRFVASNSQFIYGATRGEIFYQPPGESFYEVYQARFFGSGSCHRLVFEYFRDGKLVRQQLWRNNSLVVIDGIKVARKKNYTIGSGDAGIPFLYAYGDDFILETEVLESLGLSADDIITNASGNIRRINDELVQGGIEFTSLKPPGSIVYKSLPEARVPVYLFRLPSGQLVYLSADCHHYNLHTCKVFYGEGSLSELPIQSVDNTVRGKTSYICNDKELSILFIDENCSACSFRGQTLERLDIRNYDFVETSGQALVSPKTGSMEATN